MGRKWTKAQREAASRRATAYWAKVRADKRAEQLKEEWVKGSSRQTIEPAPEPAPELPWWRRVMLALGFGQGLDRNVGSIKSAQPQLSKALSYALS